MSFGNGWSRKTLWTIALGTMLAGGALAADLGQVRTNIGTVEGTTSTDGKVHIFKGIPYAAPPVGDLRWKAPQPAAPWANVRKATEFGARCMQTNVFGDMNFRDNGPSEDCLYLNVWTPASSASAHLPVMVWIYGGGFVAGASSEPRQDGEVLAKKGVIVVSFNYRLGIFGFFAHSDLAKESEHHSSGNYGLLDQVAALQWVQKNIAAFGGDPKNVTIFGESAGSFAVSALMGSPLAKDLFHRAIGESGAFFGTSLGLKTLAEAEETGAKFGQAVGAADVAALRAIPADKLLQEATKENPFRFPQDIDGYFFPEDVRETYANGKQAHVALLAGWNHDEGNYRAIFGKDDPTAKGFATHAEQMFGDKSAEFLKLYPASSDEEAKSSANDLGGDLFIAYSTWKWLEMQLKTGESPIYRYEFDDAMPVPADAGPNAPHGAYHSSEIEFVFEALPSKHYDWRPGDEKLSDLMSSYWTNFAKKGDPNGPSLPHWPEYNSKDSYQVMHLTFDSKAEPDAHRGRYLFLDANHPRPPQRP